jgi:hypothetical protein
MWIRPSTATGGALEELTFSELVDFWAENEIARQLREVELFSSSIVAGAQQLGTLRVLPERGGFCEDRRSIEVLVEVRDFQQRCTRIGAWKEKKFGRKDERAFDRAYAKATAHAIIQLLPATVWRNWIDVER